MLAYDEESGEKAYKPVVQLFRNTTKEWYHVHVNGEEIICTGGHPFYVLNAAADRQKVNYESQPQSAIGAWMCARQLKITDKVLLSDGSCATIEAIEVEKLAVPQTTYNFEVAESHTYYVSNSKVLVHNKCVAEDGDYKAIVNENNETEAPHAHILKNGRRVSKVDSGASIVKGSQEKGVLHFISKHKKEIIKGIKEFYPRR